MGLSGGLRSGLVHEGGDGAPGPALRALRTAALAAALAGWALLAAAPAAATTFEWSAGEGGSLWSDGSNWHGGTAPSVSEGPVDLVFPLSACATGSGLCARTLDDLPGLSVGTLTLGSRVLAGAEPPASPSPEPPASGYSVAGSSPLALSEGIDAPATVEGEGPAQAGPAAPVIAVPVLLAAPNTWTVGPAPGSALDVFGTVTGAQPLDVSLAPSARVQLARAMEVGPVTIAGSASSTVSLGPEEADLNGRGGSPVTLIGTSLEAAGATVGPLTARAASIHLGRSGLGGPLEVAGSASLREGSSLSYELPGPEGSAPEQLLARGHVDLGGAQLIAFEGCLAIGTSSTLVQASGGVSGLLTGEAGEPLLPGDTLAGSEAGCGRGRPGPNLRVEYTPHTVTVTALGPLAGGVPVGAAASKPPDMADGVASYTAAQRSQLAGDLARARALRRRALLRRRGARLSIHVPTAGTLALVWTARSHARTVTIAAGHVSLGSAAAAPARAQSGVLVVHLTLAGRRLLRHRARLRARVSETFAGAVVPHYAASAAVLLRG